VQRPTAPVLGCSPHARKSDGSGPEVGPARLSRLCQMISRQSPVGMPCLPPLATARSGGGAAVVLITGTGACERKAKPRSMQTSKMGKYCMVDVYELPTGSSDVSSHKLPTRTDKDWSAEGYFDTDYLERRCRVFNLHNNGWMPLMGKDRGDIKLHGFRPHSGSCPPACPQQNRTAKAPSLCCPSRFNRRAEQREPGITA